MPEEEEDSGKGLGGPAPEYGGDKSPGKFDDYEIQMLLWLKTTNLKGSSRGPALLKRLKDKAFDAAKHMAKDAA